jgi:branched-chain amino acid aminotransferase
MRFWVGDRLVEPDQAVVSVLDHGFTVADGVFETLKVVAGVPFALTRHLRRLVASAEGLGLPAPDLDLVREATAAVCGDAGDALGPVGRLRITYTAGTAPLGSDRGTSGQTLVVAASPATAWPSSTAIAVVPWPRNERSPVVGLKTTSYADNVVALAAAKALGAGEAVMGNTRGELCEGTGSNVFVVVGGRVLTPPLESGALAGITRELVLEWTGAQEETLPLSVLQEADEVFLTSSTRDVMAVHAVLEGDSDLRLPVPGPLTAATAEVFAARAADSVDP